MDVFSGRKDQMRQSLIFNLKALLFSGKVFLIFG